MNIALVIAGGSGQRMQQDIPKQFINVYDKPIIIYTLEAFQKHPQIDSIVVVCIDGWQDVLNAYAKQFNITKLDKICNGGHNGQASIKNGVNYVNDKFNENDIILVHDAIRPMVSEDIITDCIDTCKKYGSAITSIPCAEAMLESCDGKSSNNSIPRNTLKRTQTPQAFSVKKLMSAHKKAKSLGITNSIASCTLMVELGQEVYLSNGSEKNLKITTVEDIEIFKALIKSKKDDWIK